MKRWLSAVALSVLMSAPAAAQTSLTILTGSTSGVYYPLGNAISGIFGKSIPGVRASVQVTQGSVENLNLLEAGDGELAFSLGDAVSAAWKGDAEADSRGGLGSCAVWLRSIQTTSSSW